MTQGDIRAIQLAKSALYAGARLLMDELHTDTLDRIVLAGAFGAHISPKHAMVLGMIPDCLLENVTSAGNAAGTGARIALCDITARSKIEAEVGNIQKIETAIEPKFQEHFVAANAIPHATAPFPELSQIIALPDVSFLVRRHAKSKRNGTGEVPIGGEVMRLAPTRQRLLLFLCTWKRHCRSDFPYSGLVAR